MVLSYLKSENVLDIVFTISWHQTMLCLMLAVKPSLRGCRCFTLCMTFKLLILTFWGLGLVKIAALIQLSHTGINLFAFIDILAQSVKQLVGIFVPFLLKFQSSLLLVFFIMLLINYVNSLRVNIYFILFLKQETKLLGNLYMWFVNNDLGV